MKPYIPHLQVSFYCIYYTGENLALDLVNKYYIDIPARTLNIGNYSVTLLAYVNGTYGTDHSAIIYINIEPTPLVVSTLIILPHKHQLSPHGDR